MIHKKEKKKKLDLLQTYSKFWVTVILIFGLIDLQLSYVLAFLDKVQIAESLSVAVVTEIIAVMTAYLLRAYFDTATESKHNIEREKIGLSTQSALEDDQEKDNLIQKIVPYGYSAEEISSNTIDELTELYHSICNTDNTNV